MPTELGALTVLEQFSVAGNKLVRTLPTEFGRSTNIMSILLEHNEFTGTTSTELGLMTGLEKFFASANHFVGSLPRESGRLTNIKSIFLEQIS